MTQQCYSHEPRAASRKGKSLASGDGRVGDCICGCKAEAQRTQEPHWGWKRTRRARWPRTTVKTVTADRRDEPLCPLLLNLESNEQREGTIGSGGREVVADFGKSVSMGGKDKCLVTVSGWDTRTLRKGTWALTGSRARPGLAAEGGGRSRESIVKRMRALARQVSPLLMNLQVGNFQRCECVLARPVMQVCSCVWHTQSPVCIFQSGCAFVYFTELFFLCLFFMYYLCENIINLLQYSII